MTGENWKFFNEDMSLDAGKAKYRELLKKYHPDLNGGDDTVCKQVIAEFELFVKFRMYHAFREAGDEKTGDNRASVFADVLNKIIGWNMRVEIVGYWIYAFDAYEYRKELANMGFWFATSKKAWVYSGTARKKVHPRFSMDGLRSYMGSQLIRDKERVQEITA